MAARSLTADTQGQNEGDEMITLSLVVGVGTYVLLAAYVMSRPPRGCLRCRSCRDYDLVETRKSKAWNDAFRPCRQR
jgi:hypothetical protein